MVVFGSVAIVAATLLALLQPAAALTQGSALSILAVLQVGGTLLFAYLGVYAEKDFFLLLGNVVCMVGAVVWVFMLLDEDGNPTWITFFLLMALLAAYATFSVFNKYRLEGLDSDDEGSDEDEATRADRPQLADTTTRSGSSSSHGRQHHAKPRRRKRDA